MKPKILILTTTLPLSESCHEAHFVLYTAKELQKYYDVVVLAPWAKGAKLKETLQGVPVERFKYSPTNDLCYGTGIYPNFKKSLYNKLQAVLLVFNMWRAAKKAIRTHNPSIINAWFSIPTGYIASKLGVQYIVSSPGTDLFIENKIVSYFRTKALNKALAVTVLSQAMKDKLGKPCEIIPIGVFKDQFEYKTERDKKIILYVGRLNHQKGIGWLIRAFKQIKNPELQLWIIGEGDQESNLKEQASKDTRIKFLGPKPNSQLQEYYHQASILVMPSTDYEGLGMVLIEAISCGTVCIASSVGGIKDIIIDKKTGLLVPEKDPQSIAHAITTLLNDTQLYAQIQQQAREHVLAKYTWESIGKQWKELIEGVI